MITKVLLNPDKEIWDNYLNNIRQYHKEYFIDEQTLKIIIEAHNEVYTELNKLKEKNERFAKFNDDRYTFKTLKSSKVLCGFYHNLSKKIGNKFTKQQLKYIIFTQLKLPTFNTDKTNVYGEEIDTFGKKRTEKNEGMILEALKRTKYAETSKYHIKILYRINNNRYWNVRIHGQEM